MTHHDTPASVIGMIHAMLADSGSIIGSFDISRMAHPLTAPGFMPVDAKWLVRPFSTSKRSFGQSD